MNLEWTFAIIGALLFCHNGQVYADELSTKRPAREAQCLIKVGSEDYLRGECLFTPLDRTGSFRISAGNRISALVKVKSHEQAEVFWSGEDGGNAKAVSLGDAKDYYSGCWIVDMSGGAETGVCAWDKNEQLFLGPTPAEPPSLGLAWGERAGMYAQILSSAGLGTENATVTAIKDRGGAINWCRQGFDYSSKCIEDTLKDDRLAAASVTLHANCKTKKFTDFWRRNLKVVDGEILDDDGDEVNSGAAGMTVAQTAFDTLCPEQAKK